jgi:hypothetical protein
LGPVPPDPVTPLPIGVSEKEGAVINSVKAAATIAALLMAHLPNDGRKFATNSTGKSHAVKQQVNATTPRSRPALFSAAVRLGVRSRQRVDCGKSDAAKGKIL